MAEARVFLPVKLICGVIYKLDSVFRSAQAELISNFGPLDSVSEPFPFSLTDYYDQQMGGSLLRRFVSFEQLCSPEILCTAKQKTNALEEDIRIEIGSTQRAVNLDPGCLSGSALIMATAKDFAHRVPLREGIYAHLELLFGREGIRTLDWTYPDFRGDLYHTWLLSIRSQYLEQLRASTR
jgi:hypothetical protein